MPARQQSQPPEAGAGGTTGAALAAGERRLEVEEALWPLDGHRTVTRVLTKLIKPSVPVKLVGPQVILPLWWVPASRGSILYLCVIRRHFLACEDIAGGSKLSTGVTFFSRNTEALSLGPRCQVEE